MQSYKAPPGKALTSRNGQDSRSFVSDCCLMCQIVTGANSYSGFHVPDIDGYHWLAMFLMCLRYSYHGVSIFLLGLLYSYHGVSIFLVLYMRARKASLVVPA